MAFTSWCDLKSAMQTELAAGNSTAATVSRGDKSVTYRSVDEFWKQFQMVCDFCAQESGVRTRTTLAGQGSE